jgi:hypothetical protein
MNAQHWQISIERVVVTGAPGPGSAGFDAAELGPLIERALIRGLGEATLPAGKTVAATVQVTSGPIPGGAHAVARAVASGVTAGLEGTGRHG